MKIFLALWRVNSRPRCFQVKVLGGHSYLGLDHQSEWLQSRLVPTLSMETLELKFCFRYFQRMQIVSQCPSHPPILSLSFYISFSYSFALRMVKLYISRVRWNRAFQRQLNFLFWEQFTENYRGLWKSVSLTSRRQIKARPRAKSNLFLVIEAELESRFPDSQSISCFYPPGWPLASVYASCNQ